MGKHIQSPGQSCPLGPISQVRADGMRYYAPVHMFHPPRIREVTDTDRAMQQLTVRRVDGEAARRIEVDGVAWTLVQRLSVDWDFAPDDPRHADLAATRPVTTRHVHAGFQLGRRNVHVDYVMFMSSGPLSGTEEFQVFVDGVLMGRGGLFACPPAGFCRNWPLAIRLEDELLSLDKTFDGGPDLSSFTGLSLWSRDMTVAKQSLASPGQDRL